MLDHTEANIEKTVKEESRKVPKNKSIFSLKTQGKYRKSPHKKRIVLSYSETIRNTTVIK